MLKSNLPLGTALWATVISGKVCYRLEKSVLPGLNSCIQVTRLSDVSSFVLSNVYLSTYVTVGAVENVDNAIIAFSAFLVAIMEVDESI